MSAAAESASSGAPVALLAEGVDRNKNRPVLQAARTEVALLAEGVDRNCKHLDMAQLVVQSPSSRRAWIEIFWLNAFSSPWTVALLAEGVDRN